MNIRYNYSILYIVSVCGFLVGCGLDKPQTEAGINWITLLDKDLSKWNIFLGVPHTSVDLPGYPKGGDGINGTPIGLNKDPLNVFTVEELDGTPVLRISGEIYGGLSTKEEFENYHLKMEHKWGEKRYEPRLDSPRNGGILYHAQEPYGQFWNAWMKVLEMQVQEGDIGDSDPLGGTSIDIRASETKEDRPGNYNFGDIQWIYDPTSEPREFRSEFEPARVRKIRDYEKPTGEWNTLEVICLGDKSLHIVNGHVVMVLENAKNWLDDENYVPLTRGKIELQAEGAELFYRNIKIRKIESIPDMYLKQTVLPQTK